MKYVLIPLDQSEDSRTKRLLNVLNGCTVEDDNKLQSLCNMLRSAELGRVELHLSTEIEITCNGARIKAQPLKGDWEESVKLALDL